MTYEDLPDDCVELGKINAVYLEQLIKLMTALLKVVGGDVGEVD